MQLTIMITIDKGDGNTEFMHPIGDRPPGVCSRSQEVGDRIL